MPGYNSIINLPYYSIKKIHRGDPMVLEVVCTETPACIHCNSEDLRLKNKHLRRLHHESFGMRRVQLEVMVSKFKCKSCNRYFTQRLPGVLPYKRATEPLRRQVFEQHKSGVSQAQMAKWFGVGASTVERWFHDYYLRKNNELKSRSCPRVLGIDEHYFSKKDGYATTFCDLGKHKIFDVVKGRYEADLASYLRSLQGREKVRVVCMDLSSSYRSLIRKYFPNAKIVTDRFHVIRLINQQLIKSCRQIDANIKSNRGLLAILRKNPKNLTKSQIIRRNEYFKEHPAIKAIYEFKQQLHQLMMKKALTQEGCKKTIPQLLKYIQMLKESPLEAMKTLGKTIQNWAEEIARMWRFTKSNGITEGFHRKMKLIQRRAYGFKNFENYRLRVRILCS